MLANIIYKPIGIVLGIGASKFAGKAYESAYERTHGTAPPKARTEEATWGQVITSVALRATTFAVTAAVVDRAGAKAFRHVTGFWPGDKEPAPAKQLQARNP